MGAKDDTEKVLRDIHVLFSKAQPYNNSKVNVVVNKDEVMELLKELNNSMYKMMEEYEMTKASRDKAARKQQKLADEKAAEAKRKAEDVYAASIIYMDQTISRIQDMIKESNSRLEEIVDETRQSFDQEAKTLRANQSELQGQLQDFIDTEKYLHIIEDENRRREKEKAAGEQIPDEPSLPLSEVMTEIRVNTQYIPGYEEGEAFPEEEPLPEPEIIVREIPKVSPIRSTEEVKEEETAKNAEETKNEKDTSARKPVSRDFGEEIPDFGEKRPDPKDAPEIEDYGFDWKELDDENNHDEAVDRVLSLFGKRKK